MQSHPQSCTYPQIRDDIYRMRRQIHAAIGSSMQSSLISWWSASCHIQQCASTGHLHRVCPLSCLYPRLHLASASSCSMWGVSSTAMDPGPYLYMRIRLTFLFALIVEWHEAPLLNMLPATFESGLHLNHDYVWLMATFAQTTGYSSDDHNLKGIW